MCIYRCFVLQVLWYQVILFNLVGGLYMSVCIVCKLISKCIFTVYIGLQCY